MNSFEVSSSFRLSFVAINNISDQFDVHNRNIFRQSCGGMLIIILRLAVISAKNHKRQRHKRQSVTTKREK